MLKPTGVLLHGPPGCGKTTLAHAIAREAGVPFFAIAAPEIVSGMSGESEMKIRQLFAAAANAAPSIIFIDEVDAIVPKRESAQRCDAERSLPKNAFVAHRIAWFSPSRHSRCFACAGRWSVGSWRSFWRRWMISTRLAAALGRRRTRRISPPLAVTSR